MTREQELYNLYEQGFEKVLAILLQKQKLGKYDEYEKIILFEINKILNNIERETLSYSKKDMPTLYEWNRAIILAGAGVTEIPSMVGIDKRTIKELQKVFDGQIFDGITQVRKNIHSAVRKMALEQKISGGKLKQKVSEAVDFLAKQNIFTFEDKLGRVYSLESYAAMAIKTIQTAALNSSVFNASLQLKNDLVKMSSHSTSCPICAMFQGRIYSITGKTKGYPALETINNGNVVQYKTVHPNCRHRFTVYVKEFDDNAAQMKKDSNKPFEDTRSDELKEKYINRQKLNYYRNNKSKIKDKLRVYEAADKTQLTIEQKHDLKKLQYKRKIINNNIRELTKKI